jgi:hypothetical protein
VLRIKQIRQLARTSASSPGCTHDGVVTTPALEYTLSIRHFELACRSNEVVRVPFTIDACDRDYSVVGDDGRHLRRDCSG